MSNFYFNKTSTQVLKWALDNSFEGLEIWTDIPYFYVDIIDEKTLKEFQKANNELEYTVHAPIYDVNICSVNPGILKESMRQILKIMEWIDYFPIKRLIVHIGRTPSRMKEVMKKVREIVYNSLYNLKKEMKSKNIELLIENMGLNKFDYDRDIDDFKSILKELDIGMCLDTGHVNITWGAQKTVGELGEYVKEIHVSDNFGKYDEHLPVGEGNINWMDYKFLICELKIPVVHEIQVSKIPEEATLKSRRNLEEIFKNCFT